MQPFSVATFPRNCSPECTHCSISFESTTFSTKKGLLPPALEAQVSLINISFKPHLSLELQLEVSADKIFLCGIPSFSPGPESQFIAQYTHNWVTILCTFSWETVLLISGSKNALRFLTKVREDSTELYNQEHSCTGRICGCLLPSILHSATFVISGLSSPMSEALVFFSSLGSQA